MLIQVVAVDQHLPLLGADKTVEGHHQRGLARPAGADQGDELARVDGDADVVENPLLALPAAHLAGQVHPVEPDAAGGGVLLEAGRLVHQFEGADLHHIPLLEDMGPHQPRPVDESPVRAVEVAQPVSLGDAFQSGVVPGDDRRREMDVRLRVAPDNQGGFHPQSGRADADDAGGRPLLADLAAGPEGETDGIAVRVADAQDVAIPQMGFLDPAAVDESPVGAVQVGVIPIGSTAFQPPVMAGDVLRREDDVVVRPASNGEHVAVQRDLPLRGAGDAHHQARLRPLLRRRLRRLSREQLPPTDRAETGLGVLEFRSAETAETGHITPSSADLRASAPVLGWDALWDALRESLWDALLPPRLHRP